MQFQNSLRARPTSKYLISRQEKYDGSMSVSGNGEYSSFSDVYLREYWMSPISRQHLIESGLLSVDGKRLIDPDRERRHVVSMEKLVAAANRKLDIQESKRKSRLLMECDKIQKQLVNELKWQHIHACTNNSKHRR